MSLTPQEEANARAVGTGFMIFVISVLCSVMLSVVLVAYFATHGSLCFNRDGKRMCIVVAAAPPQESAE